jgi:hypothetical protein
VEKVINGNAPHQYYRKYNLKGKPLSKAIRIDTSHEEQYSPSLHLMENGNLLVGWQNYNHVKFRFFDVNGNPVTNVMEPDSTEFYRRNDISISYVKNFIAIAWKTIAPNIPSIPQKEKIYLRIFDESGKPKSASIVVDEKQTELQEFNPQVVISNNLIYVGWITDKQDIRISYDAKIKDSCSVRIASFDLTGKRLGIKTMANLPVEFGADEFVLSENQNKILASWWSISSIKNDSETFKVSGILIDSRTGNAIKIFDFLYRSDKYNHFGFTFDFPDTELTEVGDVFCVWYGNMGRDRNPGDVYWGRTRAK